MEVPEHIPLWYCPLLVVQHEDKPGKWRICQDAASRVNGINLNDHLIPGPDLLNNMMGVTMGLRKEPVVLCADVKDFFHQIGVAPLDLGAMRFLWFTDETMENVKVAVSKVHFFGAASSPPVAAFTLHHHAEMIRHLYPVEVIMAILWKMYVDDYVDSIKSIRKARQMRILMTEAFKLGGLILTKWTSNRPAVLIDDDTEFENYMQSLIKDL